MEDELTSIEFNEEQSAELWRIAALYYGKEDVSNDELAIFIHEALGLAFDLKVIETDVESD